ncbi:peptidoglycan-binding protein [bacterium]|nr:peptidoglycan-binding protein [bacterium]
MEFQLPSLNQWFQITKVLTKKEKAILIFFLVLFLGSASFLFRSFYLHRTILAPAVGGVFKEGVVGQPKFINPIYLASNDVDRDLTELIYSGLMKYNLKGEIVPDLAKTSPVIKEGGRVIEVYLRDDAFFHDGEKVKPEDVIFTIKTIQNPESKSPIRANWLGVKVEKISKNGIRFTLEKPYASFLERLTLKIIPAHIWKGENFALSLYHLKPIGSGPYQFEELEKTEDGKKIKTLKLKAFPKYYGKKPFIPKISFVFFDTEKELIESLNKGEIQGAAISLPNYHLVNQNLISYSFSLPRYFAVFFNLSKNDFLKNIEIRKALNYATNRKEIVEKVLEKKGKVVSSPLLPQFYNFSLPTKTYEFDLKKAEDIFAKVGFQKRNEKLVKVVEAKKMKFREDLEYGSRGEEVKNLQKCLANLDKEIYPEGEITGYFGKATKRAVIRFQEKYAKEILEPLGLKKGTGKVKGRTRDKLNEVCLISPEKTIPFELTLTTVDEPLLLKTANLLKKEWEKLGIEIKIEKFSPLTFKEEVIKKREYEAILFGEMLGMIPDPYPFWHSSQRIDPGLNLAKFKNKEVDKLLEEARTELSIKKRTEKYEKIQDILVREAPGIFLYNPNYLYFVSPKIKGIKGGIISEPSKRFIEISDWYIKTKRVWQKNQ